MRRFFVRKIRRGGPCEQRSPPAPAFNVLSHRIAEMQRVSPHPQETRPYALNASSHRVRNARKTVFCNLPAQICYGTIVPTPRQWKSKIDYVILAAMTTLPDARRQELIERVSEMLRAWHLREPAIVLLTMHAPLAFLGSQFMLAAQPFVGVFTGDQFAHDLALLLEDPQNIEQLVTRLEASKPSGDVVGHI